VRKAPAAITVIRGDEIALYGWRTLADLLRSVTGVYTAYDRAYTYAGVRGFLQSGDYNARILLLIDGHRINDNIFDSGLIGTEFPLDLSLIDRVEFLRGPGSSMYGTNAELGVVNVITKHPERAAWIGVASEVDSFAGRTGEISGSMQAGQLSFLGSGSLYRSNGAARLYFPEYSSPETNDGVAKNLDGDRFDHLFAVVRSGAFRVEGLFGKRDKIIPNASYGTVFADPRNRELDTRAYFDASYTTDLSSKTQLDVRVYYDAYRYWGVFPYASAETKKTSLQINDAAADWFGIEAVVGRSLGSHRVVAGLSSEYSFRLNQRNYYEGQQPFLDDNRHRTLAAAFGEAELNPHPRLSMNMGGRVDWYGSFGSQLSPRVAIMYLPTNGTSVKYIFSKAFRAPDPYDQFYVDEVDITAKAGNLVPEHSRSQNLLLDHAFSGWFRVSGGAFATDIDKVIREQFDVVDGSTHFVNGKVDKGQGVEVEEEIRREPGWSARSSLSWMKSTDGNTHQQLMNSPSRLFKLNGTLPITRRGMLGTELLYSGSQTNYARVPIASSFLTNMTLSTRSIRDWRIAASCYNVLDRAWATPTGPEVAPAATVQDGRTFRFRIEYRRSFERRWPDR
jgi:iron complex outermembrane receptor protein